MGITSGVKVPTSYKNLKEPKIKGFPWYVVAAWGGFFILASISSLFLIVIVGIPSIPGIFIPLLLFGSIAFFTARDKYHVKLAYKTILLLIRTFRKENEFKRYQATLDDIKKVVPIETVEKSGLIRYINGTTGFIIALSPPRISEDDIDTHNTRMMNVVNSLYGKYAFQFLSVSTNKSENILATTTRDAMNRPGVSQPVNEHIHSIYKYAAESVVNAVEWDFLLIVYLPFTKTVDDAETMKAAFLSGLTKELTRAGALSNVIDSRTDVIRILRKTLTAKR